MPPPGAGGPRPSLSGPRVLAGWWSRVVAQLIDGAIVGLGAALLVVAITAPTSSGFFADDTYTSGIFDEFFDTMVGVLIAVICVSFVALIYAPTLMARTNGQTIGRKATGIRVVRTDGERIDYGFAVVREVLVKALLFGVVGTLTIGVAWFVDMLWPLWDEENRALHDFLVKTRTIRV